MFILLAVYLGYLPLFAVFLSVLTLYGMYYISKATVGEDYFLYDVIIDGELLLLPILLIVGKLILYLV